MFGTITLKHREEVSLDEARTRLRLEIEKLLIERHRFEPSRFATHTSPITIEELATQNGLRVLESIDAGRMNYVSDLVAAALERVGLPRTFEALTCLRKERQHPDNMAMAAEAPNPLRGRVAVDLSPPI